MVWATVNQGVDMPPRLASVGLGWAAFGATSIFTPPWWDGWKEPPLSIPHHPLCPREPSQLLLNWGRGANPHTAKRPREG